jgi:2-methylcitrate dehydratase PrpD
MFCKQTQNTIDTILRLKSNEDLAGDAINKIASVTYEEPTKPKKNKGELQEFQQLLKGL